MVGPWRIGKTVGEGSSGALLVCVCVLTAVCRLTYLSPDYVGRVKLAKHKVTGQYAAVKIVPKPRKKDQDRANKVRSRSQQRDHSVRDSLC